jgi:uncharacterized protein with HEPN domain
MRDRLVHHYVDTKLDVTKDLPRLVEVLPDPG